MSRQNGRAEVSVQQELPPIVYVTRRYGPGSAGEFDWITGWTYEGGIGLFDSYTSALAASMGLWEEYCAFHRTHSKESA